MASDAASQGRIEVLYGCMFGGKTEELLRRLRQVEAGNVQAFKHARDVRYGVDQIVSHAGHCCSAEPVRSSAELFARCKDSSTFVAIDEGHFFDDALPDVCVRLRDRGCRVVITALQPNSWGMAFPIVDRLIRVADRADQIFAVCARCGRQAELTQRTTPVLDGQIVGGPEAFEPRCPACWSPPAGESVD